MIEVLDFHPAGGDMAEDVLRGLSHPGGKRVNSKWLYDETGSRLFDEITRTEAYYPTATEMGILDANAEEIAARCGPGAAVIELGSGSSLKIRKLLSILDEPSAYVPVEISRSHMDSAARELIRDFPSLTVLPVCADFLGEWDVPELGQRPRLMFFPGSTYGNFEAETRLGLLASMRSHLRPDSGDCLLLGLDLRKDRGVLELAYDDPEGISARFAMNVLTRINRELGADFDSERFKYRARYNEVEHRVEMGLVSLADQVVTIGDERFGFSEGELLHTENSYKFTPGGFVGTAESAGLTADRIWTDERGYFAFMRLLPV